jgi:hypothetical protein
MWETLVKHKISDTVTVKNAAWMDGQKKDEDGNIQGSSSANHFIAPGMKKYAGMTVKILDIPDGDYYALDCTGWGWEDWMFEDGVCEEIKEAAHEV